MIKFNFKFYFCLVISLFLTSFILSGTSFAAADPAGTNVIKNGTVYMVTSNEQLRPYTSSGAFLSYGFNSWASVRQATDEDMLLPQSDFIPPRDGKIFCSDNGPDKGTCYLITNGKTAAFVSEKVFKGLGFNFSNVLYGDVSFMAKDSDITSTSEQHRTGVVINQSGVLFMIGPNGLISLPSLAVLETWGYSVNDVVSANTADSDLSQTSILSDRQNDQLAPYSSWTAQAGSGNTVQAYIDAYPSLATATTTSPQDVGLINALVLKIENLPNAPDDAMAIVIVNRTPQENKAVAGVMGGENNLANQFQEQKTEILPGTGVNSIYPYLSSQSLAMLNNNPGFSADWGKPSVHLIAMNAWGGSVQIFQGGTAALYIENNKQVQTGLVYPYYWVFIKENGTWKVDLIGTLKYRHEKGQKPSPEQQSPNLAYTSGTGNKNTSNADNSINVMEVIYTNRPTVNDPNTWMLMKVINGGQTIINKFHLTASINNVVFLDEDEFYQLQPGESAWFGVPINTYWTLPGATQAPGDFTTKVTVGFDSNTISSNTSGNISITHIPFSQNYSNP